MDTSYIVLSAIIIITLVIVFTVRFRVKAGSKKHDDSGTAKFMPNPSESFALEYNRSNEITIPIVRLPTTIEIAETRLFEITDHATIARISQTFPAAAETAAKTITNKALKSAELYKLDIPSASLTKSKDVEGAFRAFSRGKNKISKNANLVKVDPAKISKATSVANGVANVVNVGSLVVGQYYMSEINSKLETINKNIDKISDFQDREFKSRVSSLLFRVGEISQFSSEILEREEQRRIKLTTLEDLKGITTELLAQVNLTTAEISQKNPNPNYQDYQKHVNDFNLLMEYQNVLILVLEEISKLTYLLGKGSVSTNMSFSLFNKFLEQSIQTRGFLEQWHDRQVETLRIDLEKNRKSKTGVEGFLSTIPGLVDDKWNYKELTNGLGEKISAQKASNQLMYNVPEDIYGRNIRLIIKDGKYYYLHEASDID